MIVDDFDRVALPVLPFETDAPLIVDTNAVLSGAVPFKRFQAICGRNPQVSEVLGGVEHPQLPTSERLNLIWQAARQVAIPDAFGLLVRKGPDHE
jgi:hypothetical protein